MGVDLSFAPCIDIDHGISSVIGDRALHADAAAVAELGVAYMLGMREAGMAATGKHFPGHGAVAADSHVALPIDRREWPDLEADLQPYRRLIANGLPSVMVAHVVFPAIDEQPGKPVARLDRRRAARRPRLSRGSVCRRPVDGGRGRIRRHRRARAARSRGGLRRAAGVQRSRKAVESLLDAMRAAPDPVTLMRLARLHGREADAHVAGREPALAGRRRGGARAHRPAGAAARRRRPRLKNVKLVRSLQFLQPPRSSSTDSAAAIRAGASAEATRRRRRVGPSRR